MPDPSEPRGEPEASAPSKPAPRKVRRRTPDAGRLRARLLSHIERQIARFDAVLDAEPPPAGFDSAKVLRDLGGLKNLLDDMRAAGRAAGEGGADGTAGRATLSVADLVAMRADIARRYAAFAAAEPDDGVPGSAPPGSSAPA
ncbi:UNVERIFIED_CONTAM: hypothetical protein Q9R58_18600 [Methylobacteriaceae bacterium AG10]|nr:hypothetical protein [Methylobacteriaceae bacterium AG10]